jgi:hypothetical protein
MITISVKRGDQLKVVAKAWNMNLIVSLFQWSAAMGTLSHYTDYYEWEIKFAQGRATRTFIY